MDFSSEKGRPLNQIFVVREQDENNKFDLKKRLASLYSYLSKRLGIKESPKVVFSTDKKNSENPFGLTGYYDQAGKKIKLFTTDRHNTDILRSFAHEVIHHWQKERGTLTQQNGNSTGYAQNDPNLRKREMEAYLFGNILFRDWQDENRYGIPKVQPFLPQPLNENLQLNSEKLQRAVAQFLNILISNRILSSYHRDMSSGDMQSVDFINDLSHKILSSIEMWVKTVNNRSNRENDTGKMIKE